MKKLSEAHIFQRKDILIECTNIRNYTFRGRVFKVILVEINSEDGLKSLIFTVDIEILNGSSITVISHHVNASDGKSVPKLFIIDKPGFILTILKNNLKEIKDDNISKEPEQ